MSDNPYLDLLNEDDPKGGSVGVIPTDPKPEAPAAAATDNPYLDLLNEDENAPPEVTRLKVSHDASLDLPTDKASRINRLVRERGWDPEFVGRNLDTLEKETAKADFDPKTFAANSPVVAEYVGKTPENFAALRDDIDNEVALETLLKRPKTLWPRSPDQVKASAMESANQRFAEWEVEEARQRAQTNRDRTAAGMTPIEADPSYKIRSENMRQYLLDSATKEQMDIERFVAGTGKVGFVEGMVKGHKDNPLRYVPYAAQIRPLAKAADLYSAVQAANDGTINEYQKTLLENTARMVAAEQVRGKTIGANVGDILANLPAFGGELATSGGLFTGGQALGRKAGLGGAEKLIEKTLTRMIKDPKWLSRTMVLKGIPTGAVGAAAVATISRAPATATGVYDQIRDQGVLGMDPDGNPMYEVKAGTGAPLHVALRRAWVDQYAEVASEYTGKAFEFIDKPVSDLLYGWWARRNPGKVASAFQDFLKRAQISGAIGESMEERVGSAISAVGGTGSFKDVLPTPEQLLTELVAFSVPGAAGAAIGRSTPPGPDLQSPDIAAQVHDQISDNVGASKLRERVPEDHARLVEDMVRDTDYATTHIPVEAFKTYFQSAGLAPEQVAKDLGASESFKTAEAAGTDVQVSTAVLHTKLDPKVVKGLSQDIRFDPVALTKREAGELKKRTEAEAVAKSAEEPAAPDAGEEVAAAVEDQLKSVKVPTQQAKALGTLWGSMARMDELITGSPAGKLLEKMGLSIRREGFKNPTRQMKNAQVAWDKMTPEERDRLDLVDPVTGTLSENAWDLMEQSGPPKATPQTGVLSVDGFAWVNDNWGHEAGDDLLKYVGQAAQAASPTAAKVGGNFRMFVKDQADMDRIRDKVYEALPNNLNLGGNVVPKSALRMMGTAGVDLQEAETARKASEEQAVAEGRWTKKKEQPPMFAHQEGAAADKPKVQESTPPSDLLKASRNTSDTKRKDRSLYDPMTGWHKRASWEQLPKKRFRAAFDLNKLGEVNRLYGKEAGNAYLKAFSDIIEEVQDYHELDDADNARTGGDEFWSQSDDGELLDQVVREAVKYGWSAKYSWPDADGKIHTNIGVYFSAGVAGGDSHAESALRVGKQRFDKLWTTGVARIGPEGSAGTTDGVDVRDHSVETRMDEGTGTRGDAGRDTAVRSGRKSEEARKRWVDIWNASPIGLMRNSKKAKRLLIPKPTNGTSSQLRNWRIIFDRFRHIGVPVTTDPKDPKAYTKQNLTRMFFEDFKSGDLLTDPFLDDLLKMTGYDQETNDVDTEFDELYDYLARWEGATADRFRAKAYDNGYQKKYERLLGGNTYGQPTLWNRILGRQRNSELQNQNMELAARDTKTGKTYTAANVNPDAIYGMAGSQEITNAQTDGMYGPHETLLGQLAASGITGKLEEGYVDNKGRFYTQDEYAKKMVEIGNTYNQPAYHGSPHIFDKFSLQKIGTGEGNQSYGWGLYFAGKKEVADYYKNLISSQTMKIDGVKFEPRDYTINQVVAGAKGDIKSVKKGLENYIKINGTNPYSFPVDAKRIIDSINRKTFELASGRTYQVDIPEDKELLDWDKNILEQSEFITDKIRLVFLNGENDGDDYLKQIVMDAEDGDSELGNDKITGAVFYDKLQYAFGDNPEKASEYLNSIGIKGIRYLDAASRTKGEGTHNYVIWDDSQVSIEQYWQPERGFTRFSDDEIEIVLKNSADKSTFLHESAHAWTRRWGQNHVFLKAMNPAELKPIQKRYLDRADTLLKHLGVESFDDLFKESNRPKMEQIAEEFETYMQTGKAPSKSLQGVFQEFKEWLMGVYKKIRGEVHPEVRDFFDSVLATAEEVEQAQSGRSGGVGPMLGDTAEKAETAGLDPKKAARYQELQERERLEAEAAVARRLAEEAQERKSKEFEAKREAVKQKVSDEVDKQPAYAAAKMLRDKKYKLDLRDVNARIAASIRNTFPELVGELGEGIPPAVAADAAGYDSPDTLLDDLSTAFPRASIISVGVDREMKDLYPELKDQPGAMQDEADSAVHNEATARRIHMELEHLARKVTGTSNLAAPTPSVEMVRAQARRVIGNMKLNQIRPEMYKNAEIMAAREAGRMAAVYDNAVKKGLPDTENNRQVAYAMKEKELLNHELYRAARDAQKSVEKAHKFFETVKKGSNEDLAPTRDMALVDAARAVLGEYWLLGRKSEQKALAYLEQVKSYDPDLYNTLSDLVNSATAGAGRWQEVPYRDFMAMRDAVEALWEMSRELRTFESRGEKMEIKDAEAQVIAGFMDFAKKKDPTKPDHTSTWGEKLSKTLMDMTSFMRRVRSWVDMMDLGDINGTFHRLVWSKVDEPIGVYRDAKKYTLEKLQAILKPIEKTLTHKPIAAPELGFVFKGKAELLGALLHIGNLSNLLKLLRGYGWGYMDPDTNELNRAQWDAFIRRMWSEGTLTKADYDAIQGIWDLFEELKPGTQKAHRKMFGWFFKEIPAESFSTPWGTYRGGYVPARVDPMQTSQGEMYQEKFDAEGFSNSFSFPTTGKGFTEKRVENYAEKLLLDIGMVSNAMDWQLRFTHIEPHVKDLRRLLWMWDLRKAMEAYDPTIRNKMLMPWLDRVAKQRVEVPSKIGNTVAKELRRRTGMAIMTLNVKNTLEQYGGLSVAAAKVGFGRIAVASAQVTASPIETGNEIAGKSAYMRHRIQTQVIEVQSRLNEMILNPNAIQKGKKWIDNNAYCLQSFTQGHVDKITWMAAYNKAYQENKGMAPADLETKAVREADNVVALTQGSFNPEEVSDYESGNPWFRIFTMFSGYFNMIGNLQATELKKIQMQHGLTSVTGGTKALKLIFAVDIIPVLITTILNQWAFNDGDDEWELDDFIPKFMANLFSYVTGGLPVGAKDWVMATIGKFTDQKYDDDVRLTPVLGSIQTLSGATKAGVDLLSGDGNMKDVFDVGAAIGLGLGIPIATKPVKYGVNLLAGESEADDFGDVVRGVMRGR